MNFERGIEIKVGAGSASVVDAFWDGATYIDLAEKMSFLLGCDVMDLVFLDSLSNGGERGAGLAILRKAVTVAHRGRKRLVVLARSEVASGQAKLRAWYEGTRLLEHVHTHAGRSLDNLFIAVPSARRRRR